ncbi:U2 small nuclear RNA auxiliary factor small subunit, U2AF-59 [Schizosaccharomyces osmophilus]|uniref:Splicing factor U2AF subunit n=1 Tax=Schizosaccharomyces osmophilus TaxID=2545709 RepID=A0AAF0ATW9_9SCHI|nr:U2 small nuclear RNA auxiliary factor small subunit, U2AF-59 [Schizosaccharomyces osmophilus]WBW71057.1 U2 small nuclear RNA auxiliary factor small subunit, U2AF-59 [Schizosaccharomyces osmophilus]
MDLSSRISESRSLRRSRDPRDESVGRMDRYSSRDTERSHYRDDYRRRHRDDHDYRRPREYRERSPRDDERPKRRRYDDHDYYSSRQSSRRKSVSPPASRSRNLQSIERELEQLRDVKPINEWVRQNSQWDIKPPGYELVTADQAKMSGLFPLPGAPRTANSDPEKLLEFARSAAGSIMAPPPPLQPGASRQARRLVVSNLPSDFDINTFKPFIEDLFISTTYHKPETRHFSNAYFCKEDNYAILELSKPEDATFLWGLHTAQYAPDISITFNRIKNYIVPQITHETANQRSLDFTQNEVLDSKDKVYFTNFPSNLNEQSVIELFKPFGELLSFQLIKNVADESSKGFGFCEYSDPENTGKAIQNLDGMEFNDKKISVGFSCVGLNQKIPESNVGMVALTELAKSEPRIQATPVLQIHNVVTENEATDPRECEEIQEAVGTQLSQFGKILDIKIPQQKGFSDTPSLGIGKVYVRFADIESAEAAMQEMRGFKFDDRTIVLAFYGEDCYKANAW